MVERIEQLLNAPVSGADAPTLARMEDTLTEGYAEALALEAERWRIERRISEVTQELESGDLTEKATELTMLAKRLEANGEDLMRLRALLIELRRRADDVRVAAL